MHFLLFLKYSGQQNANIFIAYLSPWHIKT